MMTPKLIESWFRLVTEAMGGSTEAQEAFKLLSSATSSQDELMRWMTRYMPTAAANMGVPQPEVFSEWVDQWWKVMGAVPRYRYLELLERNEELRRRLEECEKTRKSGMGFSGQTTEDAQKAMSQWGSMMDETLKMQSEWMRRFFPQSQTPPADQEEQASGETDAEK